MNKIQILLAILFLGLFANACKTPENVASTSETSNVPTNPEPEFPGGDEAIEAYFENALTAVAIPELRIMTLDLKIGPDGKIISAALPESYKVRYISAETKAINLAAIDSALMQAARKMPAWQPAIRNGQPAGATVTIAVLAYPEKLRETVKKQRTIKFVSVEQQTMYPGGHQAFLDSVKNNIRFPNPKPEGVVVVNFLVDRFGKVTEPVILKSLHPEIDKEVLRLVSNSVRWQPAIHNGIPSSNYFTMPLKFTAQD